MTKFNVKAILIDFGGTLFYSHQPTWQKYKKNLQSTLKNHGHQMNLDQLNAGLDRLYMRNTRGKFKTYKQYWTTFLKQQHIPPQTTLIENLDNTRKQTIRRLARSYPHAIETLSKLHRKYRMALVSNCTMNTRTEINNLGLAGFFEHMSLSYEVGARKPDKRIYLDALNALNIEGHECIFVADEISDLEGARPLKMKTLLVRQGSSTYEDAKNLNFKPDAQCNHISQITQFL